jgi:hypothetical protein
VDAFSLEFLQANLAIVAARHLATRPIDNRDCPRKLCLDGCHFPTARQQYLHLDRSLLRRSSSMQVTVEVPKAFSVRDEHEFFPIQHLLARLNPKLMVVQVATGVHVNGGCTVYWGLIYQEGQPVSKTDIETALKGAGFDFAQNGSLQTIQLPAVREDGKK